VTALIDLVGPKLGFKTGPVWGAGDIVFSIARPPACLPA
jgi:hypothetical protein